MPRVVPSWTWHHQELVAEVLLPLVVQVWLRFLPGLLGSVAAPPGNGALCSGCSCPTRCDRVCPTLGTLVPAWGGAAPQTLLLLLLLMPALPSCLQGQPGPDPWPPLDWDSEGDLGAEQWPLFGTRLAQG